MARRRIVESDGEEIDYVIVRLTDALVALGRIDARHYAGDEEVHGPIREARLALRTTRKSLRHVVSLKWKR